MLAINTGTITDAACATQLENSQHSLPNIGEGCPKSQLTCTQIDTTQCSNVNVTRVPPPTQIDYTQVSENAQTFEIQHATPSRPFPGSAPECAHEESPDLLALDDGSPDEEHGSAPGKITLSIESINEYMEIYRIEMSHQ